MQEETIGGKSSAEVQIEFDALLKEREAECLERKKRHRKIRKYWDRKVNLFDKKKYDKPTHFVAPVFEAVLLKATEECAELKDLHSDIAQLIDQLSSACAG